MQGILAEKHEPVVLFGHSQTSTVICSSFLLLVSVLSCCSSSSLHIPSHSHCGPRSPFDVVFDGCTLAESCFRHGSLLRFSSFRHRGASDVVEFVGFLSDARVMLDFGCVSSARTLVTHTCDGAEKQSRGGCRGDGVESASRSTFRELAQTCGRSKAIRPNLLGGKFCGLAHHAAALPGAPAAQTSDFICMGRDFSE